MGWIGKRVPPAKNREVDNPLFGIRSMAFQGPLSTSMIVGERVHHDCAASGAVPLGRGPFQTPPAWPSVPLSGEL